MLTEHIELPSDRHMNEFRVLAYVNGWLVKPAIRFSNKEAAAVFRSTNIELAHAVAEELQQRLDVLRALEA